MHISKKIKHLFLYNIFINFNNDYLSGVIYDNKPPENAANKNFDNKKKNKNNAPIDENIQVDNKNKVLAITGKNITIEFLEEILEKYPNTKFIVFIECIINTTLNNSCKYLLINSITGELNVNDSFLSFEADTLKFYNILEYSSYLKLSELVDWDFPVKKIKFNKCQFKDNNIDSLLKMLNLLNKKEKLNIITIENCNYTENMLQKIKEFTLKNSITFSVAKKIKQESFVTDDIFDIKEPNDEDIFKQGDVNIIPKTIKEFKSLLEKRSDIIPDTTRDQLFIAFNKYKDYENKKKRGMITKKEEDELTFIKTQIETILKLPENAHIRKDLSYDLITLLITKIFRTLFPSGLDEVLQMLINLGKSAVTKGKVEYKNTILNGPPGVGKTSVTKIIAYVLCLLGSDESLIPLKLIKESQSDDFKLAELITILEANYYKHIVTINVNGINDPSYFKGTNSFYVGATSGKIVTGIATNIKGPLVLNFDEIDKAGMDKNGQATNKQTVGSTLLNLFDGQTWTDTYLNLPLSLKTNIFFVGTSNVKENIDTTLANRFAIVNIASPTLEGKKHIVLSVFIKLCVDNKLIKNIKDFTILNSGKSYKIGPFILDDDILTYLMNITHRSDGLRDVLRYIEELFNNLFVEYNYNKKDIIISKETLIKYLTVNELEEEFSKQNVFNIIYENKDGNNNLGQIFFLKVKNNSGKDIHILGSNQENYYTFSDLGLLVGGLLKNLNTLCSDINSTYGLSLVTQYFVNQQGGLLLQIPTNGTEDEYKNYMVVYLIVGAIALIRDLKFRNDLMPLGVVLPNGDFSIGRGKIQNKVIAATKFKDIVNGLILPKTLENNKMFQNFLKKNNIKIKIYYCSNLSEILHIMLINN
jgi:ATP-dependent Lon protease